MNKMINLLPTAEKEKLHHEYSLRVAVVSLFLLLLLLFIANVLLVPSYILSSVKLSITRTQAADVAQSTISKQKENYKKIIDETNEHISDLSRGSTPIDAAALAGSVARVAGPDVSMTGILYQDDTNANTLQIHGIAKDRDALIALQGRLEALHEFKNVEVPVSSLVSDTNIHFSMDLDVDEDGGS